MNFIVNDNYNDNIALPNGCSGPSPCGGSVEAKRTAAAIEKTQNSQGSGCNSI